MSAFGGKADMTVCGCLLSRSLLGVKRTRACALHMSAFDPKRTLAGVSHCRFEPLRLLCPEPQGEEVRRRDFITFVGGAAATPLVARAQQNERLRRTVVLQPFTKNSPESARVTAFVQELQRLGWTDGRNLQIEYRWEANDLRKAAMELVALSPDVILVSSTPAVNSVQQATRTIPVVFTQVADPISAGIVASLAKPGGNTTGFMVFDYEIAAKWLELLKEIAPNVTRVGAIRDPTSTSSIGQLSAIQSAARF